MHEIPHFLRLGKQPRTPLTVGLPTAYHYDGVKITAVGGVGCWLTLCKLTTYTTHSRKCLHVLRSQIGDAVAVLSYPSCCLIQHELKAPLGLW